MTNLSQLEENSNGLWSAKSLYTFLGVKTPYHKWFARQVEMYGFRLQEDFWTKMSESQVNGRPSLEHWMTPTMGKEMSMTSKGNRAKEARLWFIECEKKLKEGTPKLTNAQTILKIAQEAVEQERRLGELETKVERIEAQQREATEALLALPEPQVEARKMTDRALIRQVVNSYAMSTGMSHQLVWNKLYQECYYRLQINVTLQAKNKKLKPLDILEQEGVMTEVYAIACEIFKP